MLNIFFAEIMKSKRNRVFLVSLLFALVLPALMILKDRFAAYSIAEVLTSRQWASSTIQLTLLLAYPILSGFIITNMMQREYTEHTIINNLTAPVSRTAFYFGKLLILATWQAIIAALCYGFVLLGVAVLFPGAMAPAFAAQLMGNILIVGTLSFLSFLPVMSIAVLQRTAFYPSLIACLLFALIGSFAHMMPPYLVNVFPWSAVMVYHLTGTVYPAGMLSIALCTGISVAVSIVAINRQDL